MRTVSLAPLAIAAALLLTVAGCAADAPDSSGDSSQSSSDDTDADTDTDTGDDATTDDSGMSDLVPVFTDAPASPGPQVSITAKGFEPGDLTVTSGDIVTFTSGDDGTYSLIVNQLDGVTVASSLPEYYQFNDPGTYYLKEDLSGNTGTITVQ